MVAFQFLLVADMRPAGFLVFLHSVCYYFKKFIQNDTDVVYVTRLSKTLASSS